MITYAVDSSGEIVKANIRELYYSPESKRLNTMNVIRHKIMPYLKKFGADDRTFSVALQPYGYEDRLIWFTKIHAESDSEIVKSSQNALHNKNYVYESKAEENLFKSVFPVTENDKTEWYLLYAESFCITRNIYDKKIISAVFEDPVPYEGFMEKSREMQISKKEIILEERTDKMKYLSAKVPFEHAEALLKTALPRTDDKNLDAYFKEALKDILESVEKRDRYSNEKTRLLMYLADNAAVKREARPFYSEISTWAEEEVENKKISEVTLCKNIISVATKRDKTDIYVCKKPGDDGYIFIVKGRIFEDTEHLKRYLKGSHCYEDPPEWWDTIIKTIEQ